MAVTCFRSSTPSFNLECFKSSASSWDIMLQNVSLAEPLTRTSELDDRSSLVESQNQIHLALMYGFQLGPAISLTLSGLRSVKACPATACSSVPWSCSTHLCNMVLLELGRGPFLAAKLPWHAAIMGFWVSFCNVALVANTHGQCTCHLPSFMVGALLKAVILHDCTIHALPSRWLDAPALRYGTDSRTRCANLAHLFDNLNAWERLFCQ